ncbi:MAG: NAD(P)H-dependent oxidoreductase [Bdellovibrio sp.]|nr:NAD(P)H-dependent oxidoreductase [Bdellovibrio sp.]
MLPIKSAVLVGSLRKESFNRKVAKALIEITPESVILEILEIGQLQMYNQDLDDNPPTEWTKFRDSLKTYDAVIFVTPEYNRSVPAVLKNAIDIASRPYGKNVFDKKPCAVISVSIGSLGGFGANHHLRQSLVFLNAPTMALPEAYLANASKLFHQTGKLADPATEEFLKLFMASFVDWAKTNSHRGKEASL